MVRVLVYLAPMLRVKFKVRFGIRKEFSIPQRLARIPTADNSTVFSPYLPRLAQGDANNKLKPRDLVDLQDLKKVIHISSGDAVAARFREACFF